MGELNSVEINFLIGLCAFNFCLSIAILLFLLKLWLDVYHLRWLELLQEIRENLPGHSKEAL